MHPTIGRIVHYKDDDGSVKPAIVEDVNTDGSVWLHIFDRRHTPQGSHSLIANQLMSPDGAPGWFWPPLVVEPREGLSDEHPAAL